MWNNKVKVGGSSSIHIYTANNATPDTDKLGSLEKGIKMYAIKAKLI
jgi:hypothetical protein